MIWSLPAMLLLAAWLRLDCILFATAAVLGLQAFLFRMDHAAPMDPWRAALRSWLGGAAAMAAGIVLIASVAARLLGLWGESVTVAPDSWLVVGAAVVLLTVWANVVLHVDWRWSDAGRIALLAAAGVASGLSARGWGFLPCVYGIVAGISVAYSGWRLARHTGTALMAWGDSGNRP